MIERVLTFSVRQRWFVVLLTAMAAGWGIWSLVRLPIDAVPDITNNQVQINTVATALSPSEIEKQVTLPVETSLAGIPGLEYTRSMSRNGFSQVTAVFSDRTDIYFARQQVGERLTDVRKTLPPGIEPHMGPITTGLGEIYVWLVRYLPANERAAVRDGQPGWQSDGSYLTPEGQRLRNDFERVTYLRTVQDWIIRPQLRHTSGVAGIDAIGGYVKQYHVQPDPSQLNALGISFGELAEAIERNNTSRGAGYLDRFGEGYVVRTGGRIESMQEIGEVVVATRGGIPVRIRDVASVAIGGELRSGSASQDGEEVVAGTALMRIGANSRAVSAAVDAKLRDINRTLPPGIEAKTVLDRTVLVNATIRTVGTSLSEGALLVVLVLFLLLGNFRAAMITALVIPLAMLLTATGMLQGRISANLMSLGALDFGLIVDGAVVIGENCLRRIAERQRTLGRPIELDERLSTVIVASKEMIQPTVYGQAIIILVYVPLLTFSGVEGKMFEPMALTVILALASAFILSLTAVPALIAILVTGRIAEGENGIIRALKGWYAPALAWAIRSPIPAITTSALLFVVSLLLFMRLGQEFIPTLDEKDILLQSIRIPSTSLDQSQAM
jgi:heavy metal efflux system protein